MEGRSNDLVFYALGWLPKNRRQIVSDIVLHMLDTQLVYCEHLDAHYSVLRGSGMGMVCSGSISDLSFYGLAEEFCQTDLRLASAQVGLEYFRYRDDLLLMVRGPGEKVMRDIAAKITKQARTIYTVNWDEPSLNTVNFLDVSISKAGRRLEWVPYIKDTSMKRPLGTNSFHAPSVHMSWPKGELVRLSRRSSSRAGFVRAKAQFLRHLERFWIHPLVLSAVRAFDPWTAPRPTETHAVIWLVLPYHPCLVSSGVVGVISRIFSDWRHVLDRKLCHPIRVSWKNAFPNLGAQLRRIFRI